MSSLIKNRWNTTRSTYPFKHSPNYDQVRSRISDVELDSVKTKYLEVDYINGEPMVGSFVTTDAEQTLTNKSLVDNSTYIISNVEPTGMIRFTSPTTENVTTMITSLSTENRNIIIPDSNGEIILNEGEQTINGRKIFTDIGFQYGDVSVYCIPINETVFTTETTLFTIDITGVSQLRTSTNIFLKSTSLTGSNVIDVYVQVNPFKYGISQNYIGEEQLNGDITVNLSGNDLTMTYTTTHPDEISMRGYTQLTLY